MERTSKLIIDQAMCTVCRACLLACHYHHTERFGTSDSSVHINYNADSSELRIVFDDTCDLCASEEMLFCAHFCVPGAIQTEEQAT